MAVEKPLNFSVLITAEQDALKVSLKVTVSFTHEGSSDLQTYTLTDRNEQRGRKTGNVTFCDSEIYLIVTLETRTEPLHFVLLQETSPQLFNQEHRRREF